MIDGDVDVVVDAANVVGSRPDGWWRDRAGAAERLLVQLAGLSGGEEVVRLDGEADARIGAVHAVLEGLANAANDPMPPRTGRFTVVRAAQDGDSAVVDLVEQLLADSRSVLVVTADRGLRARLPGSVRCMGPRWLRALLDSPRQE